MRVGAVLLMVPSLSLGLACNVLAIEPGQAPSVKITWPMQVVNGANSGTTDVQFEVENCDTFTTQVERRGREALPHSIFYENEDLWEANNVKIEPTGFPRSYVAHLPRAALVRDQGLACFSDDANPYLGELRLKITCGKATRTAVSSPIPVHFTASEQSLSTFYDDGLISVAEPDHFIAWGTHGFGVWHPEVPTRVIAAGPFRESGEWSHDSLQTNFFTFAVRGTQGYVAGRCPLLDCGTFTLPDGSAVDVSYVYKLDLAAQPTPNPVSKPDYHQVAVGSVQVPGHVNAIAVDRDGSALVFSSTFDDTQRIPQSIVSRVHGDQVTVEKIFQDRIVQSISTAPRQDGDIAIAFWHMDGQRLIIDRHSLLGNNDPQVIMTVNEPDHLSDNDLWLSPDGDQWIVVNEGVAYLGGVGVSPIGLTKTSEVLAVWNSDSVLLRRDDNSMVAFARGGNHEQLFDMPGNWSAAAAALPNGGYVVSPYDDTLVRFVDARGNILGESALAPCGYVSPAYNRSIAVLNDGGLGEKGRAGRVALLLRSEKPRGLRTFIHQFAIPEAPTPAASALKT